MLYPLNEDMFSPYFRSCLYWLAEDVELTAQKKMANTFYKQKYAFFSSLNFH